MSDQYQRVQEAKDYFVEQLQNQSSQPQPVNLRLTLLFGAQKTVFQSLDDMETFSPSDFVATGLEVSTDGALSSPLKDFLNMLICQRFGLSPPADFAIERGSHTYGVEVLHHAPELLCEDFTQGHGQARLILLPRYFPFCKMDESIGLEALWNYARGEALYYGSPATPGSVDLYEKALPLLEEAHTSQPNNAMFTHRLAACLIRLGKKRRAVQLLAEQQKVVQCAKIYWRMCWLLYSTEKFRNCLVTLHGGAAKYLTRSKTWSKFCSLARRCLVVMYGSAVLSDSIATQIGYGVMHMILLKLPVWDVLRASQVCFAWNTFASFELFWKKRIRNDFGSDFDEVFHNCKQHYRKLLNQRSRILKIGGVAVVEGDSQQLNKPGFRLWKEPQFRDVSRFVWQNFLSHLRQRGLDPLDYPAATGTYRHNQPWDQRFKVIHSLASLVLNQSVSDFEWLLLPRAGLSGITFCNGCSYFTRDEEAPLCGLIHPGHSLPTDLIKQQIVEKKIELTAEAKKKISAQHRRDELENLKQKYPRFTSVYTCCGAKTKAFSVGCTRARHSEFRGSYGTSAKILRIITALPGYILENDGKDSVQINLLPKNHPLKDPFLLPFESLALKKSQRKPNEEEG